MVANNERIARLELLLAQEECRVERKALMESDEVAKIKDWDKKWAYYEEAWPRDQSTSFSYTPSDWVKRQDYLEYGEMKPLEEETGYAGWYRAEFWTKQYLKVILVTCLLAIFI